MWQAYARETSHSHPRKVADSNDFDVYTGFLRSARYLAARLKPDLIKGQAEIRLGDARTLEGIDDESFDLALTSPPYLDAIDYLRGHRLSLVWLGYEMKPLREIRSASVGAENMMLEEEASSDILPFVLEKEDSVIAHRHLGWIRRYAYDMEIVCKSEGWSSGPAGWSWCSGIRSFEGRKSTTPGSWKRSRRRPRSDSKAGTSGKFQHGADTCLHQEMARTLWTSECGPRRC